MTVTQIATLLNIVYQEVTGETENIVNEGLTNVVDLGTTVFSSSWKDKYVKGLIDQIGKMIFVDRPYQGFAPSIIRSDWEYGSILAKIRAKDFEAKENPSWKLTAGQTVDQFEYNPPEVKQTFWNQRESWQIDCSFAEIQVKSAFKSAEQMNAFFSMIESTIDSSRNLYMDALAMRTINNFILSKIASNNGYINVLSAYNTAYNQTLTPQNAQYDPQFLRFLAFLILDLKDQLKIKNSLYNLGGSGYTRHTPEQDLHIVLHSIYARATEIMMQADTYHDNLTKIGMYETVPFWQNLSSKPWGNDQIEQRTSILATVSLADEVEAPYIVGVLFDRDAIAMNNTNIRVTSAYNANGEYYNNFYKVDTNCINDLSENGVVLALTDIPT